MKVEILERTKLHQGFVRLEKIRLRYQRFSGQMSQEVSWETLLRSDSVAVLPYDPERDTVVLSRQFRLGPHLAGEQGWCLEIVAGGCSETDIHHDARREVLEEIGWEVTQLQHIVTYYPAPHLSIERVHLFLGIIDSRHQAAPGGGLLHEDEDIEVLPMPFAQAMQLLHDGQISNSPAYMGLHWLAQHRQALRQTGTIRDNG
ncbi:MAG: NUDIX domain-containing protein [Magnetococcus sp. MYC-9]